MFVKKKPNRSGSTTVVVVEKEKGASRYLRTIGTSSDPAEIAEYVRQGEAYIASCRAALNPELDFDTKAEEIGKALNLKPIQIEDGWLTLNTAESLYANCKGAMPQ